VLDRPAWRGINCIEPRTKSVVSDYSRKDSVVSSFAKLLCGVAFLVLMLPGCSGPTLVWGKGQLRYNEKPLEMKGLKEITVKFIPLVKVDREFYYSDIDKSDSTFKVGWQGQGIPAGKYKIAIEQKASGTESAAVKKMNKMFSPENTQIVRELKDETPINLELSKPEG
jgi:hypothetical protein